MTQTQMERLCELLEPGVNNKKENDVMDLAKVKVIVGNKAYTPNYVDWIQDPFSDPRMKLDVTVSPGTRITHNTTTSKEPLTITNVIFNPPATIVFWSDKTKTVVKCDEQNEWYDPEKGLAMAISRKMLGDNKREYYNTFLHWLKKWEKQAFEYRFVNDVTEIEIVGLCTDICVVSNALLLKAYFYDKMEISVDATCCAGVTPETHEAALKTMEMCQINVKR